MSEIASQRGGMILYTGRLVIETCYKCGVAFGIPEDMQQRRVADRNTFWCPAGHGQHYTGKSEAEQLQDKLAVAERRVAYERSRADQADAEAHPALTVPSGNGSRPVR